MQLKAYSVPFVGHWPVGAVAVVFAASKADAIKRLEAELAKEGLMPQSEELKPVELDTRTAGAHILLNGEY